MDLSLAYSLPSFRESMAERASNGQIEYVIVFMKWCTKSGILQRDCNGRENSSWVCVVSSSNYR